jgi:hypothetical protein
MEMPIDELMLFNPTVLLQELYARESLKIGAQNITSNFSKRQALYPYISAVNIKGEARFVPELSYYRTIDIISALQARQEVVYGIDARTEMYMVTDPSILNDADSVVALIKEGQIEDNGDGTSALIGPTLGTKYNLCPNEPFHDQPSIPICSGFLVDPSIIATAYHCIEENPLDTIWFVFGYVMSNATTAITRINNSEIYRGVRILKWHKGELGDDWVLIQLDRPVLNHPYVRIRRNGKIPNGEVVHVIGYPSGLPMKYTGGAVVRDNTKIPYFIANLDTHHGNSGSPVFNSLTHTVEGILITGEDDWDWNGSCQTSKVCRVNGCMGEYCVRITALASYVPRNELDCVPFDPGQITVERIGVGWKIVAGDLWLLDFEENENDALIALKIIKHYGMNSQCFVGRPYPSMIFYLVNGKAPEGPMIGEDTVQLIPLVFLEVKQINGRWKIVKGNLPLMDFNQQEDEARQALSYILRYGFQYICYVGNRTNPSMIYFRK